MTRDHTRYQWHHTRSLALGSMAPTWGAISYTSSWQNERSHGGGDGKDGKGSPRAWEATWPPWRRFLAVISHNLSVQRRWPRATSRNLGRNLGVQSRAISRNLGCNLAQSRRAMLVISRNLGALYESISKVVIVKCFHWTSFINPNSSF